ncbi:hypothetical protein [Thermococcus thioreducens]|uniref:Uncharacterized protein n=2 Tax=Thermococcus thioreducens TaxID=277988 RepID=A0A1I0N394_9EURY|nr:hypothetical protein [Thermococcus thioreducens]ASJ12188.1 hypothetical protein A3L14_04495 [Thermococcus thioreducens]SEV95217.1 hypothetical protein SAMN05216170_1068 [Thermococcus thioreducens]
MLEGGEDIPPWRIWDYHRKLELLRATIGLATFAATYKHRETGIFGRFVDDPDPHHVTGRALTKVAKKKVHAIPGDVNDEEAARHIKTDPEPNAYVIPEPDELFENEENVEKLAEALRDEFYHAYKILIPDEDIAYALKKSYEIVKKFADKESFKEIMQASPSEKAVMKHPAYKELIRFLEDFTGAKRSVERPKAVQGKKGDNGKESGNSLTVEVLTMLQALKLLNYSEEAVNNAVKDLEKKIRKITELDYPTPEDVYRLGLYYLALSYIRNGKFEKAEDVFRGL